MDTEGYVLVEQLMALPQLKEFSLQDLLHGLSYACVRACLRLCVCVCMFVRGVCFFLHVFVPTRMRALNSWTKCHIPNEPGESTIRVPPTPGKEKCKTD